MIYEIIVNAENNEDPDTLCSENPIEIEAVFSRLLRKYPNNVLTIRCDDKPISLNTLLQDIQSYKIQNEFDEYTILPSVHQKGYKNGYDLAIGQDGQAHKVKKPGAPED